MEVEKDKEMEWERNGEWVAERRGTQRWGEIQEDKERSNVETVERKTDLKVHPNKIKKGERKE